MVLGVYPIMVRPMVAPVEELVLTQTALGTDSTADRVFIAETHACYNCEVPWLANTFDHPYIRINYLSCDDGEISDLSSNYEFFGNYDTFWYSMACASDATATTDFFMK